MNSADCPDENALVDFARGALSQRGRETIDAHVDSCARCRVALVALARRISVQTTENPVDITQPDDRNPIPGTVLDERFRLVDFLGVGAMGVVYEAEDLKLKERVAVKVLAPRISERPDVLEFLRREILLGRRISHPNVCPAYDLGISKNLHFISMKLVQGKTLDQLLEDGPLSPPRIQFILEQLAEALKAAHACGVVHRDLKASNVMVGANDHVWVMDFGLARDLERDPSFSGPVGTPAYWSPEQALGEPATPASDVYSFGVVAYRLWVGKLPRRHKEKTSFRNIPSPWRSLVEGCLAERVADRFIDGEAVLRALRHAQAKPRTRAVVLGGLALTVSTAVITIFLTRLASPAPAGEQPSAPPPRVVVVAPAAELQVSPDAGERVAAAPPVPEPDAGVSPAPTAREAGERPRARSHASTPPKRPDEDIPLFE